MPSKDRIDPKLNLWLDKGKPKETTPAAPGVIGSRTKRRAMSAQVQRLAKRLGTDPDELAKKLPADTLRRSKYPVIEIINEDGTRTYKHDLGIFDGPRSIGAR